MNFRIAVLMIKGFFRRYKKVANTCFIIFLVMLFVTATAIFRDNMYNMQNALNKEKFGAWYILEMTFDEPDKDLLEEPMLKEPVKAGYSFEIYESTGKYAFGRLGYMSESFVELGKLKLKDGHWPKSDNEIVLEYSALKEIGHEGGVGSTITIGYYEEYSINEEDMIYKTFTLCGIIEDFSTLWVKGDEIPRAVVSKSAYDALKYKAKVDIYAYDIKEQLEPKESEEFYQSLRSRSSNIRYNSSVYDYKLWGSEFVYNYMYIAVMCIGIAVLIYKVTDYRNTRKDFNDKMKKLGASKWQLRAVQNFEYAFMILLFGILGIFASILIGNVVADSFEKKLNVSFYAVSKDVYIRSFIGILCGLLSGYLADIVTFFKNLLPKRKKKVRLYVSEDEQKMEKRRIDEKGTIAKVQKRFSRTEGLLPRLGIRIFGLCVTFIIIGCAINIFSSYKALRENASGYDMAGAIKGDFDGSYSIPFVYRGSYEEFSQADNFFRAMYSSRIDTLPYEEYKVNVDVGIEAWSKNRSSINLKMGSNTISEGISTDIKERIENTPGVMNTKWWLWETRRSISWYGLDFDKMGAFDLLAEDPYATSASKYLFGTRYADAEKELYERFEKYIPKEYQNYDQYVAGEQVIVMIERNPITEEYDDTIKPGAHLDYISYYRNVVDWPEGMSIEKYKELQYKSTFEPVATPLVAAVIYLDDNIKEEFTDILEESCHYTMIASINMAEKLRIAEQNHLKTYKGEAYAAVLPQLNYTHFQVTFDDSAVVLATENVLKAYCGVNDIATESFYAKKNMLQTQLITAVMQNGATILLAVAVNIIVALMLVENRFLNRKKQFEVFVKIGMSKSQICKMSTIEALKENLFSPITAIPVTLIQYVAWRWRVR